MKFTQVLLRLNDVLSLRGLRKSQHYEDIQNGLFTTPVKIGARASAWPEHEVAAINAVSIAGMTDDAIRELVIKLEAARKVAALEDCHDCHCLRQFLPASQMKLAQVAKEVF
ncbi:AlpA family transcriptional regulator [Nitrosomonas sp.]|uniref:helix-turn-helix transcriptional regulator n=1 Tax=Nitrosomonas sp. TaxID=42353 RepID=UPI00207D9CEF|nr:AlpA family phage regulatory protein [Nitrosomonas sp.]GJL74547.1 MAG: hypothetical protein NMNS02_06530 [Nitrosomonas sp.]